MLKVFLGVLVSVVVLLSSAYVPVGIFSRAYAASATVVITNIQAGGPSAATQEFVVIYNNSPDEIDITGWCLTNKNNALIACFSPPLAGQAMYLPGYKHAVVVSNSLPATLQTGTATVTYAPISQSSGSITGGSDVISLLDHIGAVVDRQSWTSSLAGGNQFERQFGTSTPTLYKDTDLSTDWLVNTSRMLPASETEIDTVLVDICPNSDGVQPITSSWHGIESVG